MDHAAKVQQKKNLLLAAGINEYDAHHVANELAEKAEIIESGGPNGDVVANGQGRRSQEIIPQEGMYGTQFRQNSTASFKRASASSESAFVPPQRPVASPVASPRSSVSQQSRFGYLGGRGALPGSTAQAHALRMEVRQESPAMASNDELYAPLQHGPDVPLGGAVVEPAPRQWVSRTPSSFA
jgi:aquaporin related protein